MVAGYRDDGICPGLFGVPGCLAATSFTECFSLHVAPRHGAVIINYIHDAFIYLLLTHHPTAECAMGKPSTLRRVNQTQHYHGVRGTFLFEARSQSPPREREQAGCLI